METITLNWIALLTFFIFNTIIVRRSIMKRPKTFRDYAVGSHRLGMNTLVLTLFATLMNAHALGFKSSYKYGLIVFIFPTTFSLVALFYGLFVFPRLTAFEGEYTMAGIMGKIYGPFAKRATVVIATLYALLMIVSQLRAVGEISLLLENIQTEEPGHVKIPLIITIGIFLTLYTALGGIRSVALTNILQFILFFTGIVGFSAIIINHYGGPQIIWSHLPDTPEKRTFFLHPALGKIFFSAFFWTMWPTVIISPPIIQRCLMTKDEKRIRYMFLFFSLFYMLLRIITFLVGISLNQVYPQTKKVSSIGHLVQTLCHSSLGQALFIIAFFAVIIATVNAILNATAIMWAYDILHKTPKASGKRTTTEITKTARNVTLIIGITATLLAATVNLQLFDLIEYAFFIITPLSIPLSMGIVGLKGNKRAFQVTLFSYFAIFIIACLILRNPLFLDPLVAIFHTKERGGYLKNPLIGKFAWFFACIISSCIFFAEHYHRNGHFVFLKQEENLWEEEGKSTNHHMDFFRNPKQWAKSRVEQNGYHIMPLFFVALFLIPAPMILQSPSFDTKTLKLLLAIFFLGVGLVTQLITKDMWHPQLKPYHNLYYLFCIWYTINFSGNLIALQKIEPAYYSIIYNIVKITLLIPLLDRIALILFEISSFIAALIVNYIIQGFCLPPGFVISESIFLLLFLAFALPFIRQKEKFMLEQKNALLKIKRKKSKNHDLDEHRKKGLLRIINPQSSAIHQIDTQLNEISKITKTKTQVQAIKKAIEWIKQRIAIAAYFMHLHIQYTGLSPLLSNLSQKLFKRGIDPSKKITIHDTTRKEKFICDAQQIVKALTQGVIYLVEQNKNHPITLTIEDATLNFDTSAGTRSQTTAYRFILTSDDTNTTDNNKPQEETPSTLLESKHIILAHYGTFQHNINTLIFTIPRNIKTISPPVKEVDQDLIGNISISGEEEKTFIQQIEAKKFNKERIQKALRICKYYYQKHRRKSGEPFYLHPLAVAKIILTHTNQEDIIIAALLHDIAEDTRYSYYEMEITFGKAVTQIVKAVTHRYNMTERQAILAKGPLSIPLKREEKAALIVKIGDRLHNMRTIKVLPLHKQVSIAKETRNFFVPTAQLLNLTPIAEELNRLTQELTGEEEK